jgi:hypothetical protein
MTGCGGARTAKYAIGDPGPAGGTIIYVSEAGFPVQVSPTGTPAASQWAAYTAHYFEAAPVDEANAQWGDYGNLITGVTTITSNTDPLASEIGNGRKDTWVIVNHLALMVAETGRAAQLCTAKTTGGKTDWFLPSSGELNKMYDAKGKTNIPTTGLYWSSSQDSNYVAFYQFFGSSNSLPNSQDKNLTGNVRAVRAF